MQTYTFGSAEEIRKLMVAAAILPESDFLRVINTFSDQVARRELNAHGVNVAFQMAVYEVATQYGAVPFLSAMVNSEFPDMITAVLWGNPDFLTEVLNIHHEVLNGVGKG